MDEWLTQVTTSAHDKRALQQPVLKMHVKSFIVVVNQLSVQ